METGHVTEIDVIMDSFFRFLMSMPGGDKEPVTRTIQQTDRQTDNGIDDHIMEDLVS